MDGWMNKKNSCFSATNLLLSMAVVFEHVAKGEVAVAVMDEAAWAKLYVESVLDKGRSLAKKHKQGAEWKIHAK